MKKGFLFLMLFLVIPSVLADIEIKTDQFGKNRFLILERLPTKDDGDGWMRQRDFAEWERISRSIPSYPADKVEEDIKYAVKAIRRIG